MSSKKVISAQRLQRNSVNSISFTPNETSRKTRTLPHLTSTPNRRVTSLFPSDFGTEDEEETNSSQDKMKTMFMSMWNNVKFGFATKLKTNFSYESPIWLLGVCYHKKMNDIHQSTSSLSIRDDSQSKATAMERFKHDFYSRVWFTYRREFPRLAGSHYTTDCGWGCMLRSGQMLLAQGFLCHFLSRHWRWLGSQSDKADMIHRMVVKMFADDPSATCSPFSVHQLVGIGEMLGKKPGDWYGPASVAHLLRHALDNAASSNPVLGNICIYVAQDCTVYVQDVIHLCTSSISYAKGGFSHAKSNQSSRMSSSRVSETSDYFTKRDSEVDDGAVADDFYFGEEFAFQPKSPSLNYKAPSTFNLSDNGYFRSGPSSLPFSAIPAAAEKEANSKWCGVLILVPVRLGGEKLNPMYVPCVKELLSHPACLGIIGGKPRHSLYFVGYQDDKLIYLDPHYCQSAVDVRQSNFPLSTFHCATPRKTHFSNMDPSCTIGFYCHTRRDFFEFVATIQELLVPRHQNGDYPIFVFDSGNYQLDNSNEFERPKADQILKIKHRYLNADGRVQLEVQADEFVML